MEYALAPFAKYMGISKKKEVTRFAEQAWLVLYCTTFWSLGFVCASFALVQSIHEVLVPHGCKRTASHTDLTLFCSTSTTHLPTG